MLSVFKIFIYVNSVLVLCNQSAFVNDFNVHLRLFGKEIVCNESGKEIAGKVVN